MSSKEGFKKFPLWILLLYILLPSSLVVVVGGFFMSVWCCWLASVIFWAPLMLGGSLFLFYFCCVVFVSIDYSMVGDCCCCCCWLWQGWEGRSLNHPFVFFKISFDFLLSSGSVWMVFSFIFVFLSVCWLFSAFSFFFFFHCGCSLNFLFIHLSSWSLRKGFLAWLFNCREEFAFIVGNIFQMMFMFALFSMAGWVLFVSQLLIPACWALRSVFGEPTKQYNLICSLIFFAARSFSSKFLESVQYGFSNVWFSLSFPEFIKQSFIYSCWGFVFLL